MIEGAGCCWFLAVYAFVFLTGELMPQQIVDDWAGRVRLASHWLCQDTTITLTSKEREDMGRNVVSTGRSPVWHGSGLVFGLLDHLCLA